MLSGARVTANAGFARFHVEDTKAAQLDSFTAAERVLHGLEDRFDRLFGFGASDVGFLNDGIDDIELVARPDKNFMFIMKDGKIYKNTLLAVN